MAANREEGIADEVLDRLLAGRDPATVFETGGLVDELKKRLAERMLNAEMDIIWVRRRRKKLAITAMVIAASPF